VRREEELVALRWSHDLKTTEGSFYSKTASNEAASMTEIQVGGWGEQNPWGPRLDAPSSGLTAMEKTSSTGPNYKMVVVPDK
jgi:hypothetical protein